MFSQSANLTDIALLDFEKLLEIYESKKRKKITDYPDDTSATTDEDNSWDDETPFYSLKLVYKKIISRIIIFKPRQNWGDLIITLRNLKNYLQENTFIYDEKYVKEIIKQTKSMLTNLEIYLTMHNAAKDKDSKLKLANTSIDDFYNSFGLLNSDQSTLNNKQIAIIGLVGAIIGAAIGLVIAGIPGGIAGYKAGATGAVIGGVVCTTTAILLNNFYLTAPIKPYALATKTAALDLLPFPDEAELKSDSTLSFKNLGGLSDTDYSTRRNQR